MESTKPSKLTLSNNQVLLGVAAGIATYFAIKPIYIRSILVVCGVLFNIITIAIYLIFYAFMAKPVKQSARDGGSDTDPLPSEDLQPVAEFTATKNNGNTLLVIGILSVTISVAPVLIVPQGNGDNILAILWFGGTIIPAATVLIIGLVKVITHFYKNS